jgi:biopolymer transport protein ExbD
MAGGGGGGKDELFINLTPMIDILTCLLFFLLLGYKSQANTVEGVDLPASTSEKGLVITMTVTINVDSIKVENLEVVALQDGKIAEKYLDNGKIVPLYNVVMKILEQEKTNRLKLDKSAILLAADKRLKSDIVATVMKTCGMAGIPNFRFAVARQ